MRIYFDNNEPNHWRKITEWWLQMMRPAQLPDFNPIELVWDELDRRCKQSKRATHLRQRFRLNLCLNIWAGLGPTTQAYVGKMV
uniref:Tc1-like transposase DDE domain-containing protein n=1 Tax=Seriola lalandi dorsalis TaxID=1841481 RepID=A0A3B4YB56_SERLL